MGGRGSSSGLSVQGNKYGSQYSRVLADGNILFVTKNSRTSEPLMETMTRGRVYVTVAGNKLKTITYFDSENKRRKAINLDHPHNGIQPHTHHGYLHNEADGPKGAAKLTDKEKLLLDRVRRTWDNYLKNKP